ncbi:MAG: Peptidyl-prolyl cis-trans isomerase D [Alphaproteobacteria bacterium MarineAlpha2_Bin1]|nr:MAG: Peptidyl-prolyl cis-trans isomerase D [Alphaproteobacteria bacterium MarineAlpha2_Bin1]
MLNSMRKGISSWFIKILLALLIISFGLWGIGDIFISGGNKSVLAKVGKYNIDQRDFLKEYSINLENLSQQLGRKILPDEANSIGLLSQTLGTMITSLMYKQITEEYGMSINNSTVKKEITSIPSFKDSTGSFNKFAFERYLNLTGQTEEEVIDKIKNDIAKRQIFLSVSSGFSTPKEIVQKIYNFREEKRKISFIELSNKVYNIKNINESDLISYYEKNNKSFLSPELRSFSYINISPKEIAKEVKVSKNLILEKYNQGKSLYFKPEQRSIIQIIANSKDDILNASNIINSKKLKIYEEIKNLNLPNINYNKLENISWNELPKELADFIFNLNVDEWSQPHKSSLGWHLIYTIKLNPEGTIPLEIVENKIKEEIQMDKAYDAIYKISNQLEDQLASGKNLRNASNIIGVKITDIPLLEYNSKTVFLKDLSLETKNKLLSNVFNSNQINFVQSFDTEEGGIIYYTLNKIKPIETKSFKNAKEEVLKEWKFKEQNKLLKVDGNKYFNEIKNGYSFEKLSENLNIKINHLGDLKRTDINKLDYLNKEIIEKIFLGKKNQYISSLNEKEGKFLIIKIIDIKSPLNNQINDDYVRTKQSLDTSYSNDLVILLNKSLRKKINIQIYNKNIEKINFSGLIN